MKNTTSLFTAIIWGAVLIFTISTREPVGWVEHSLPVLLLVLNYAHEFYLDNATVIETKYYPCCFGEYDFEDNKTLCDQIPCERYDECKKESHEV